MEENLSERDVLSIDAEKYIENHNSILFQGGYSLIMDYSLKRQNSKNLTYIFLEEVLRYSVFNLFLNKVADGALRTLYGSLFQTVGAV